MHVRDKFLNPVYWLCTVRLPSSYVQDAWWTNTK